MKHFMKLGHPILSLSMRGYGLSAIPKNNKTGKPLEGYHLFDDLVEDVRAAVEYATMDGKGIPLLAAHDWGSSISWNYVSQCRTWKGDGEICGYISLSIPPPQCFKANFGFKQLWASLYMFFFNMPWVPEFVFLFNKAWIIGQIMNATKQAILPQWMTESYRVNCLQTGSMTAQFNYYRGFFQLAPKPAKEDRLGPGKSESDPPRRLECPITMIRGKDDDAITEGLFVGYDRYLSDAKLVALDQCSHWITADRPNEVNQEMELLLERCNKA